MRTVIISDVAFSSFHFPFRCFLSVLLFFFFSGWVWGRGEYLLHFLLKFVISFVQPAMMYITILWKWYKLIEIWGIKTYRYCRFTKKNSPSPGCQENKFVLSVKFSLLSYASVCRPAPSQLSNLTCVCLCRSHVLTIVRMIIAGWHLCDVLVTWMLWVGECADWCVFFCLLWVTQMC